MGMIVLPARILLAAVFAVAGTTKMLARGEFQKAVADFGVPARLAPPISVALPILELAAAALLISDSWSWWGAALAMGALVVFLVAIAANLAKGRQPDCRCFGQIQSTPIGGTTLMRNVALAACAGIVLAAPPEQLGTSAIGGIAAATGVTAAVAALGVIALVFLAAQSALLWQLFRQQGRLLLRLDDLEGRAASAPSFAPAPMPGLDIGAPAPSFRTTNALGAATGLEALLQGGKAAMLVFSDVNCPPCAKLLPEIARWQSEYAADVRIVLVSSGAEAATRAIAEGHHLEHVLLQHGSEIADVYHVQGTPAAVLVLPNGTIGSPIMMGRDAIAGVLTRFTQRPMHHTVDSADTGTVARMDPTYGTAVR